MQSHNDKTAFRDELHGKLLEPASGRQGTVDLMEIRRKLRQSITSQILILEQVEEALGLPPDKRYR